MRVKLKYSPLPHQRALHTSPVLYRLLRGGVGSGKTYGGAYEALRLAIQNPGCDGMIVAPTWGILTRTTVRTFLQLCPPQIIRATSKSERWIELKNGARIYYGSADRPETLEGANLAWIWGDEGRYWKHDVWPILIARVREPSAQRRSIVVTSTPAMGWMYDLWTSGDPEYVDFLAKTTDNTHLDPKFAKSLKATYSDRLYKQYAEGGWISGVGSAFPEFNPNVHIQDDLIPEAGSVITVAVDFGVTRPSILYLDYKDVCLKHGTRDCIHVVGEMHPDDTPTVKLVSMLDADLRRRDWTALECVVDPAGDARSIQTGERDTALFARVGLNAVFATDRIRRDIRIGCEHLRAKLDPVEGQPSIYIDSSLCHDRGITKAIASIDADTKKGIYVKDAKYDHAVDALRYGVNWLHPPSMMGAFAY